jgi:hypothetical protein
MTVLLLEDDFWRHIRWCATACPGGSLHTFLRESEVGEVEIT